MAAILRSELSKRSRSRVDPAVATRPGAKATDPSIDPRGTAHDELGVASDVRHKPDATRSPHDELDVSPDATRKPAARPQRPRRPRPVFSRRLRWRLWRAERTECREQRRRIRDRRAGAANAGYANVAAFFAGYLAVFLAIWIGAIAAIGARPTLHRAMLAALAVGLVGLLVASVRSAAKRALAFAALADLPATLPFPAHGFALWVDAERPMLEVVLRSPVFVRDFARAVDLVDPSLVVIALDDTRMTINFHAPAHRADYDTRRADRRALDRLIKNLLIPLHRKIGIDRVEFSERAE